MNVERPAAALGVTMAELFAAVEGIRDGHHTNLTLLNFPSSGGRNVAMPDLGKIAQTLRTTPAALLSGEGE